MMEHLPFYAYKGDRPYMFISYSHKDSDTIFSIIREFHDYGYPVWYDEGIDPGNEWPEEIAAALSACALFVVFISPHSISSDNVRNEINFALANKLPVIVIHLEETKLTAGMQLQIGSKQAIMKYKMTDDSFYYKCYNVFERIGLTREAPIIDPVENGNLKEILSEEETKLHNEILKKALRFEPKGTAAITLFNKTQYTVSANAMMFRFDNQNFPGMKNGLVYKDGVSFNCLPFTEMREYKSLVAVNWENKEFEILPESSPLYIIEAEKKREPLLIELKQVESIIFDAEHTVDSVAEYALIERTDDVPLVVPTASILIKDSNISRFGIHSVKYHAEIPFKNGAAVQIKSMLKMEVTKVDPDPEHPMGRNRHIEVTVTTRNLETISDEMFGWFSITALTQKGLMNIGFDHIKRITFI